jgi:hypothetical protein
MAPPTPGHRPDLSLSTAHVPDHWSMTGPTITVDYLTGGSDGPLVRFAGTPTAIAILRDAFDQLATGEPATIPALRMQGLLLTFEHGTHGGLHATAPGKLTYHGDAGQWTSRARLLDPLTQPPSGFQYLDFDAADEIIAVVTTNADGSW